MRSTLPLLAGSLLLGACLMPTALDAHICYVTGR